MLRTSHGRKNNVLENIENINALSCPIFTNLPSLGYFSSQFSLVPIVVNRPSQYGMLSVIANPIMFIIIPIQTPKIYPPTAIRTATGKISDKLLSAYNANKNIIAKKICDGECSAIFETVSSSLYITKITASAVITPRGINLSQRKIFLFLISIPVLI